MKIILTNPHNCSLGGLRGHTLALWEASAERHNLSVKTIEPTRSEIHGELLSRIWVEEFYNAGEAEFLISESDFVPTLTVLDEVFDRLDRGAQFVYARYSTREWFQGQDPNTNPGIIRHWDPDFHIESKEPAIPGAWFLAGRIRSENVWRNIPHDWLRAGGERNDAANLAAQVLRSAGVPAEDMWAFGPYQSTVSHLATYYRGLGSHAFYARASDKDPDEAVDEFASPTPLLANTVREGIRKLVNAEIVNRTAASRIILPTQRSDV